MTSDESDSEATILPSMLRPKMITIPQDGSETFTPSQFPFRIILAGLAYLEVEAVPEEQWGSPYVLVDPVRFTENPSVDVFCHVTEDELLVGRGPQYSSQLFSVPRVTQNISRLHFGIRRQGRTFTVRDCHSKNGTAVHYR